MRVSIRVKGHLNPEVWQEWFEGLQITQEPAGTSLLIGPLPDQAVLFGVLGKIRSLNLYLLFLDVSQEAEPPAGT